MKKYLFFVAAALAMVSCTKDTDELVPVNIKAKSSLETDSKLIWSAPVSNANGLYTISVLFEPNDKIDVYEHGHEGHRELTSANTNYVASANFSGSWYGNCPDRWAAVLPHGASASVDITGESNNIFDVTIPATQKTRVKNSSDLYGTIQYVVSPDSTANILIGARNRHTTSTCFLAPICTYLYFATETTITHVTVSANSVTTTDRSNVSHGGCMAGRVQISTSGEWENWVDFTSRINGITPVSGSTYQNITVQGAFTHHSTTGPLHEYVVCMYPGTYNGLKFSYTDANNHVFEKSVNTAHSSVTLAGVKMYYLGKITGWTEVNNTNSK